MGRELMAWIAFLNNNHRWSEFKWISKSKGFVIESREYIQAMITLKHPKGMAETLLPFVFVCSCMREIDFGFPKSLSPDKSAADWYLITKAAYEKIRLADGELFDEPGKYQVLDNIFEPKPKQKPKKSLSEVKENLDPDKLKKMANYKGKAR